MKIEVKIIEIRPIYDGRDVKAFVDIQVGDFILRDFRVIKKDGKRPFVKAPFSTYKDSAGQIKFRPIVFVPNDELRGEIDLTILAAYQGEMEKRHETETPQPK